LISRLKVDFGHAECRRFGPRKLSPLSTEPLVSVLIPNYNYGEFVGAALDSLKAQTYANWEALVCDDGSTDRSREIIDQYASNDRRIRPIYQSNGGVATALNFCFAAARGEIVSLLDADDLWSKVKIERVMASFIEHPTVGMVGHQMRLVSGSSGPTGNPFPSRISTGWIGDRMLERGGDMSFPVASGVSFHREVADLIFPVPLTMRRLVDGYLMRVAAFVTELGGILEPLAGYRIHEKNISGVSRQNATSVARMLDDSGLMMDEVNAFLARRYGGSVNRTIRLQESSFYPQRMLTYKLFTGCLYRDSPAGPELLAKLRPLARRLAWRALLTLPDAVGRRTYNAYFDHCDLIKAIFRAIPRQRHCEMPLAQGRQSREYRLQ
jgi:glycosyltransferase involved in cell wall biosynthesis